VDGFGGRWLIKDLFVRYQMGGPEPRSLFNYGTLSDEAHIQSQGHMKAAGDAKISTNLPISIFTDPSPPVRSDLQGLRAGTSRTMVRIALGAHLLPAKKTGFFWAILFLIMSFYMYHKVMI